MLPNIDKVTGFLEEAANAEIMPRFQALQDHEVREKAPGDLVTDADIGAERLLTQRFTEHLPGSVVVGEEAVSADRSLLKLLDGDDLIWVVDPVDGTSNFANGRPIFAVMVALVRAGRTIAAWIHDPVNSRTAAAQAGEGAFVSGERLCAGRSAPVTEMQGTLHASRFGSDELIQQVQAARARMNVVKSMNCAGREYLRLAEGEMQFSLFTKLMPWDHAPGSLIYREAGGVARCLDGTDYGARQYDQVGLLMAPDAPSWQALHDTIFPSR